MKRYHIAARQQWEDFTHNGNSYSLNHLSSHEVVFNGKNHRYTFVVTYGLHCFAKNDQPHTIDLQYSDGHEIRNVNLERYHLSKYLRAIIEEGRPSSWKNSPNRT